MLSLIGISNFVKGMNKQLQKVLFFTFLLLGISCKEAEANGDSCVNLPNFSNTVVDTQSEAIDIFIEKVNYNGSNLSDSAKSELLSIVKRGNKEVAVFRVQLFACLLFLNQNNSTMECQTAFQTLGSIISVVKNERLEPMEDIGKSSGDTTSMIAAFAVSLKDSEDKIVDGIDRFNKYIRRCGFNPY